MTEQRDSEPITDRAAAEPAAFAMCPVCKREDVLLRADGRYQVHFIRTSDVKPCAGSWPQCKKCLQYGTQNCTCR